MEIIAVACVATLAVCAVLARTGTRTVRRPLEETSADPLDKALYHLINEVTRKPERQRGAYIDRVMVGSRLSSVHDKRITMV